MNISQIKTIVAIAKTGSVTGAAQYLYKSQPNISKELKDVELKYDVQLFERSYKGMIITPMGEVFLDSCLKILHELDNIEKITDKDHMMSKKCHIGTIKETYCIKAIHNWINTSPNMSNLYSISIHENDILKIIEEVASGKLYFGLIHMPEEHETYILKILKANSLLYSSVFKYKMNLYMHTSHKLASKPLISKEDLRDSVEIIQGSNFLFGDKYNSSDIKSKQIIVHDRASLIDMFHNIDNSFIFSPPIPKDIMLNQKIIQKKCNFKLNNMKDILIFRNTSENPAIIKSFKTSMSKYIDNLKNEQNL